MRYSFVGRKNTWKFDARYARAPVRNAERADDDLDLDNPDDIPDDDSGLVQLRGNRDRLALRPAWIYKLSNVSSTTVQIDYRDVSYDEAFVFLRDYTDVTLSANYRRGLSKRSSFFVTGLTRNYEDTPLFDDTDPRNEFDTIGLNIGLETQLTENLRMRIQAGAEQVEDIQTGVDETVPVGEITFIRRLETIRLLAQYRRTASSTGAGRMSEREAININFTRELGERFDAGIGVRAHNNTPIDLSGLNQAVFQRDFLQLSARFTWNVTRTFAFQMNYRYSVESQEARGESANSNQIIAWLVWRPSGLREET